MLLAQFPHFGREERFVAAVPVETAPMSKQLSIALLVNDRHACRHGAKVLVFYVKHTGVLQATRAELSEALLALLILNLKRLLCRQKGIHRLLGLEVAHDFTGEVTEGPSECVLAVILVICRAKQRLETCRLCEARLLISTINARTAALGAHEKLHAYLS